jgi:uncharacterized protein (TIGR03437 family)
MVVPAAPQVFRSSAGYAAALNEDGSVNSADNPAKVGTVVTIWATGVYPPYPPVGDGQIATGANDYVCCQVYVADLFGKPQTFLRVLYGGSAPGMVAGVMQINFEAPVSAPIVVTSAGYASDPFRVYVRP